MPRNTYVLWLAYQYLDSFHWCSVSRIIFFLLSWSDEAYLSVQYSSANPSLFEDGGVEKLVRTTLLCITLLFSSALVRRYALCLTGNKETLSDGGLLKDSLMFTHT